MTFKLEIEMDNAAFEESPGAEVARLLRAVADKIEDWPGNNLFAVNLMDFNGNRCGNAKAVKS